MHQALTVDHPDLKARHRVVLLYLADFSNPDGENAYPSKATLAHKGGMSERQVQRVLGDLVHFGLIEIQRRASRYRATTYRLLLTGETTSLPSGETQAAQQGRQPDSRTKNMNQEPESQLLAAREEDVDSSGNGSKLVDLPQMPLAPQRELMGALIDVMGRAPGGGEASAWGRVASQMRRAGVMPEDVRIRAAFYQRCWPNAMLTPFALWKHWGAFADVNNLPFIDDGTRTPNWMMQAFSELEEAMGEHPAGKSDTRVVPSLLPLPEADGSNGRSLGPGADAV